jgi:hypothetical protein
MTEQFLEFDVSETLDDLNDELLDDYYEGIYNAINNTLNKVDSTVANKSKEISDKVKAHKENKPINPKVTEVKDKATTAIRNANKTLNTGLKAVGKGATHIYATLKNKCMTAEQKDDMANKIAAGVKAGTFMLSKAALIGPIDWGLDACAAVVLSDKNKDAVDSKAVEYVKRIANAAKAKYQEFRNFIAQAAAKEISKEQGYAKLKQFEKEALNLASQMDAATKRQSLPQAVNESYNEEYIPFYDNLILENGLITESGYETIHMLIESATDVSDIDLVMRYLEIDYANLNK